MKLKRNIIIFTITAIVIVFFSKGFYDDFLIKCEYYCRPINGEIKDIKYSEQKTIKVLIEESWIPLSLNIKYDIKINIGDFIVKEANSYTTKLIKDGTELDISSGRNISLLKKYCRCD
jgi:hypothetical protein